MSEKRGASIPPVIDKEQTLDRDSMQLVNNGQPPVDATFSSAPQPKEFNGKVWREVLQDPTEYEGIAPHYPFPPPKK